MERHLFCCFRCHPAEEMDVFVCVEGGHGRWGRPAWTEDVHFVEHAIRGDEVVRHAHAMRLHRMAKTV